MQHILNSPVLLEYLKVQADPWQGTPLQGYTSLDNKIKGKYGETFILELAKFSNYTCEPRSHTDHDCIINGFTTEIKFSVINKNNGYVFNHIAVSKNYDRLIFAGISRNLEPEIYFMNKTDIILYINLGKYFKPQQGGKSGGNDDWIFPASQKKWQQFINDPCVKAWDQW